MAEWEWEKNKLIKGTGKEVRRGFIIKFAHIKDLKFRIKGKFSPETKGTDSAKDILYFKLGVEDIAIVHLPVSAVEIILNALWEINVDAMKTAKLNGANLDKDDLLLDLATRIHEGKRAKAIYIKVLGNDQTAEVELDFKKNGMDAKIEFDKPVPKRDVERLIKHLKPILHLLKKEQKKKGEG